MGKISTIIVEELEKDDNIEFHRTINHLFNKLIRKTYTKQDTQKFIDRLYESGNRKILSLIHFYGVYFELKPHDFLPKMVVDVIPSLQFKPAYGGIQKMADVGRFKNFEGFIVRKYSVRYDGTKPSYMVQYISNGLVFDIANFRNDNYRPFFNEFIKGKTILEERKTKREKIPLRKIRARGI